MNPITFSKVLERLKGNLKTISDFHQQHVEELETHGLFDFYMDRLSLGTIELVPGYSRELTKSYAILKDEESFERREFIRLEFRPEMFKIEILKANEEDVKDENLYFFYAYKLIQYGLHKKFPNIYLSYPSSHVERLLPYLKGEGYQVHQKELGNGRTVEIHMEHAEQLIPTVTTEDIVQTAHKVFANKYAFEIENGIMRTKASVTKLHYAREEKNEIRYFAESAYVKKVRREMSPDSSGSFNSGGFPLSYNEVERKEEIEALMILIFNELLENKDSIYELSKEVRERIERYLLNRFNDVRRLPENNDKNGNATGIHPDLIAHFLSGSWQEEDNYLSKLLLWLEALTVVNANAFGFIAHYDGSVEGLEEEVYILFPFLSTFYSYSVMKGEVFTPVYASKEEAVSELERFNEKVIEDWNKR